MFYILKQGEKTDDTLFLVIGRAILSKEVHSSVGMAITSEDGDWWFIDTRPSGAVFGFAIFRVEGDGKAEIRQVYAHDEQVHGRLISRLLLKAKELGVNHIVTHKRAVEKAWSKAGFIMNPAGRRGQCERWELDVK